MLYKNYPKQLTTQIHAKIKCYKATIRFNISNGTIRSINAFMGWASDIKGKLIK